MQKALVPSVVIGALMLSGCLGNGPRMLASKYNNYVSNVPDLDEKNVGEFATRTDSIMTSFSTLAGVKNPGANGEWRPVIDAGINYTDTRCDRFMDSLFWLNRARETTSRQIEYTGSAIGAALAVVEASKTAIGLTPLGFSLFDQTVNNLSTGLLYNLSPSTVRILVEKRQAAYLRELAPSYTSRAIALRVIQGYAAICLPPAIEAEVERAINAKEYLPNPQSAGSATSADDVTPNPIAFASAESPAADAETESNVIVVTGIGSPAPISIEDGKYRLVGSTAGYTDKPGFVQSGQRVQVMATAPKAGDEPKVATLQIGTVKAKFSVRTIVAKKDDKPEVSAPAAEDTAAETKDAAPAILEKSKALVSDTEVNVVPDPQ